MKDETRRMIDNMTEDQLRTEIKLGNSSRFNDDKRAYMRSLLNAKEAEKKERQNVQETSFKGQEIALAKEANEISRQANRLSIFSLIISIVALVIAILY